MSVSWCIVLFFLWARIIDPLSVSENQRMRNIYRLYQPVLAIAAVLLLVFFLFRLLFIGYFWSRVNATDGTAFILLQGLRFDLIVIGMLLGIPTLLLTILAPWRVLHPLITRGLPAVLAIITAVVVLMEASTLTFIIQYDTRPNILFVEYLKYPREVFSTLLIGFPVQTILAIGLTVISAWLAWKWLRSSIAKTPPISLLSALLMLPVIAVLLLVMIRSSTAHRPANPSTVAFSQDAMVNELPLNSSYTLLYAVYEDYRYAHKGGMRYGKMSDEKMLSIIRHEARISEPTGIDLGIPTLHRQEPASQYAKPLNLVIILEESMGAEYVGSLGGKDLTPNIDKYSNEGIWFERLYATGMRSVRGIEAILTSFTPTQARSVVKLASTQRQFFTVAELLRRQGYQTSFVYGGESHFDNMRRFFMANGFETVIDEGDYPDPVFRAVWGVSDEDVLNRAHEHFESKRDQPFFSLVFTSSNHEPFDIPAGRVEPESGPTAGLDTAIKYADYAVGQFIARARQSDYWENSIFLIIADHNVRVYGDSLVPIEHFHIPGVILGGSIEPRKISGISSQIDMLPTLLSLMGVSSEHPSIGRDLTREEFRDGAGRAIVQGHSTQAYIENDDVVVLQRNKPPQQYVYNMQDGLQPAPEVNPELRDKALAYATFGPVMIEKQAYRLRSR